MSRLYDRSFAAAFASQTCFVLANTLLAHYARWVEFLGGDVRQVGWVMGAGSVAGLALRPWIGQWINRLGPRFTWALGYVVFGCGAIGNLWVTEVNWLVFLLRSLAILGSAIVFASGLTYVTLTAPPDRRTEAIGILGAGGFIGMLTGPYLGDLILGASTRTRADFVVLFVAATAALILPMIFLAFLKTPQQERTRREVRLVDFVRTIRSHWPGSILWVNVAFGACMCVPFGFLPSFVDAEGLSIPGFSPIGLFFLGYAGWGLVLRVGLRRVPDRHGRRKVMLAGMTCMALGMFAFTLVSAERSWLLIVPALICGSGHALIFHTMTSLAVESFPSDVRGTASSFSLMMMDLGMIGGAPILGQIAQFYGYEWMFAAIGLLCFAVAGLYCRASVPVWRAVN